MIEATDRGVTISKSLAWTIVVGITAGGIWYGKEQSQTLSKADSALSAVQDLKTELLAEKNLRGTLGERLRDVELVVTRQDERLILILSEITKMSTKLDKIQDSGERP